MKYSAIRFARLALGFGVRSISPFRWAVEGRQGLEIGGPSPSFQDHGILPLYRFVSSLDNAVFSDNTIWEGRREEGPNFRFRAGNRNGHLYIREATDLHGIADASYDFVLSCQNLEHTANPLRALKEWQRVLRPHGYLILILPYYRRGFDHRRQPTPVAHMLEDFHNGVDETDLTHLPEILELHDFSRNPEAGTREQFRALALRNFENRCLHHHVFDADNSRELLESAGFQVDSTEIVRRSIVLLARAHPG